MKIINYDIIKNNIKKLKENNELMIVLKNDAYNFNMEHVLKIALCEGVRRFAVNDVYEGIRLRKLNSSIEILTFGLAINNLNIVKEYNLIPTVSNMYEFNRYSDNNIPFSVELDIGMNRFGFKYFDYNLLNNNLIKFIYIHFKDNINIKDYINKYDIISSIYNKEIVYGGSIVIPYTDKCVRIGKEIYLNSLSLYGRVVNIKYVKKDESIGYDSSYIMENDGYIGIVDIGYYNGLSLYYDNDVIINDNRYKVVGKLCMNHMFVLINSNVKIADIVEIIGKNISIDEFNLHNKTNIYQDFLLIR